MGQCAVIKITKPAQSPAVLTGRGRVKQAEHCAGYNAGQREFTFDASVYGHPTVKAALIAAQHGKCCFCERKISAEGDVEHFRPKGGFRQQKRSRLGKPGYYWLAYEWVNLLWACPICNQRFKQNYFPLRNPMTRAVNHHSDMAQEEPLLINPAEADPAPLVGFRQEVAYPINSSAQAKASIAVLGLNRPNLIEERREHLTLLHSLHKILRRNELSRTAAGRAILVETLAFLQQATQDSAKFAAMARADAAGENVT